MIFRQMIDYESFSYSYLIAQRRGGEALIFDPVATKSTTTLWPQWGLMVGLY